MAMSDQFTIYWIDSGREPQCAPNPAFPNGVDLDFYSKRVVQTCKVPLPYPARRCGAYAVRCLLCGYSVYVTTAGRPDDPRSVVLPCLLEDRDHRQAEEDSSGHHGDGNGQVDKGSVRH